MANNLEINRIIPLTQSESSGNQSSEKLFLGTVVLIQKNDVTRCSLFQTVVTGIDQQSAMTRMMLLFQDECESYLDNHLIKFRSLYEVTSDSPEYFTLAQYFKGTINNAN